MEGGNRKAKLMTVGIAVILILVICGISVIIHAIHKRDSEETGSKLQSDIMDYANGGQEQGITAQDAVTVVEGQGNRQEADEEELQESGIGQGNQQAGIGEAGSQQDSPQSQETQQGSDGGAAGQPGSGGQDGQQGSISGAAGQVSKTDGAASPQDGSGEPAVVVEEAKNQAAESIMEEEAHKTDSSAENHQTTAKWQKEANENLASVAIDLPRQMSEMKGYWEAGNMEAVKDLAYLPRYRAASEKLSGTTKYYYYGDTDSSSRPNGKGLAMYTDNQYYYGDWKNGVRSGSGMWIKFYVYDKNAKAKDSRYLQHSYTGAWNNDLPNGDGAEHYDFIDENLEENTGYNRNFIGSFKNGLYNGEIYITNYYKDGNVKEWSGTAANGVWQAFGKKDSQGKYPVIVELDNPDNYQWMKASENKNNGVNGIISAAKQGTAAK